MSVAGSTSSQGTHSRSPSRSRSPPFNDGRYPPSNSSRYRYDYNNYRPSRSGMSADLDSYRDLRDRDRDRERDRERDRSILMREDRYLSSRGRERDRDDRYQPYYREDPHHYPSSSNLPPRDYSKLPANIRRDDGMKDPKLSLSTSSSSIKELKEDNKISSASTANEPLPPPSLSSSSYSNRYDWRDRERDRERDRRYREDDRRYDRRRDGYMRYEPSSYGGPPPPSYQPYGGDSYRPDRDRDRDMPPSPGGHIPYYERERIDDRDYYRGPRSNIGPIPDYDRYRRSSGRPWGPSKISEDRRNLPERERPERIQTNLEIRSGRTSPSSYSAKDHDKKPDLEQQKPEKSTNLADIKPPTKELETQITKTGEELETGEVVDDKETHENNSITLDKQQKEPTPEPMDIDKGESSVDFKSKHELPMKILLPPQTLEISEEKKEEENRPEKDNITDMTQEQIVERIDDIENQISTYEELLEAAIKREEEEANNITAATTNDEDVDMPDDEEDEDQAAKNKEEAKKQALQAMENDVPATTSADMMNFADDTPPMMRKRPQLLINQLRGKNDELEDELYEKILQDNRNMAKQNSSMLGGTWQGKKENLDDWSDEEKWTKPLYPKIEDFPCYKENLEKFGQLRIEVAECLHSQKIALKKKERFLKNEYKALYDLWKDKNMALDRMRANERKGGDKYGSHRTSRRRDEPEEYVDNVIFVSGTPDALRFKNDGTSTPYGGNGHFTSDAARSEAELLEIIQSLESAEMRNPESRAKKTTATIPPMILDVRERMRTYDDRSGLVKDPLTYYHTGPDTGDVWNQQEVTTFMESYMMYPKQFERISAAVGTKTACQCVLFYYRKKKKIDFKALMKKGRRGKTTKHRDRIAAAIRAVTGESGSSARKTKSKGSALMTDIGEAQVSRKAKEKDAERKSKELRDLEQANAYWEGVAERKKTKRPSSTNAPFPPSGTISSASEEFEMMLQQPQQPQQATTEKRRTNSGSFIAQQRRKGRSPRESTSTATSEVNIVLPNEPIAVNKKYVEEKSLDDIDERSFPGSSGATKWSEREKELAIEGFKQYGRDFTQVSTLVKTKTEEQCRNFYHNFKRKFGPNAFNEEDARQPDVLPQKVETTKKETPFEQKPAQPVLELPPATSQSISYVPAPVKPVTPPVKQTLKHVLPIKQTPPPVRPNTPIKQMTPTKTIKPVTPALPVLHVPPIQQVHSLTPSQPAAQPLKPTIHEEVVALSGRTDLKAEEEDAAAALVDMFQMGSNTPRDEAPKQSSLTSRSRTPSTHDEATESTHGVAPIAPTARSSSPSSQFTTTAPQQKRRRVRSASSRSESVTTEDASDWNDPDYGVKSGGRKIGRSATLTDSKRPAYSSYWSVVERNDFAHYLGIYGKDWEKIANAMKSKTMIQVRNFYTNNEEKMQLKEVADRYQARQQEAPPKPYEDAHFQALQNFPFPSPIVDQKPGVKPTSPPKTSTMSEYPRYYPQRIAPSESTIYKYTSPRSTKPSGAPPPETPSAVTKVADLLNNDEPAESSQNSWETWFGN